MDANDSPTTVPSAALTLEDVMKVINSKFAQTFARIDSINGKLDTVKAELDQKLDAVSRDFSSFKANCEKRFKHTDDALVALDSRIDVLSQEIGGLENHNELVVSGIPFIQGENLGSYFAALWKHVGLREHPAPLVDVRRLRKGSQGDGLLLLQFALRNQRNDFYSSYLQKRDLQLNHLGLNSDRRIYINENLAVAARKIKKAALQLKKSGKLSSVYSKKGVVHVKHTADQQTGTAVFTESQLEHLS